MFLHCKRIEISDEYIGSGVSFYENEFDNTHVVLNPLSSIKDITNSIGNYISINKTYAEDEFEEDFCYIEQSDFDKSGEFKNLTIDLYPNKITMLFNEELYEINFEIDTAMFIKLKNTLEKIMYKSGKITHHQ